jgi:hypothetical protein
MCCAVVLLVARCFFIRSKRILVLRSASRGLDVPLLVTRHLGMSFSSKEIVQGYNKPLVLAFGVTIIGAGGTDTELWKIARAFEVSS